MIPYHRLATDDLPHIHLMHRLLHQAKEAKNLQRLSAVGSLTNGRKDCSVEVACMHSHVTVCVFQSSLDTMCGRCRALEYNITVLVIVDGTAGY